MNRPASQLSRGRSALATFGRNSIKRHLIAAFAAATLFAAVASPVWASNIVKEWASVKAPSPPALKSVTIDPKATALGVLPIKPNHCTALNRAYCPKRFYSRHHKIENFFCRVKDWWPIATCCDKLARNFLAAATLVGVFY